MKEMIKAQFTLTDEYWSNSLRVLYKYKRPFRYYQVWIGLGILAPGIVLLFLIQGRCFLPIAIMLAGAIETIEPSVTKRRFMRDFRSNPGRGGTIAVEFGAKTFRMQTPNSDGEMKWSAPLEVLQAPAGLLIFPQKRLHFFIPAEAFGTAGQIPEVMSRFQGANVKTKIIE